MEGIFTGKTLDEAKQEAINSFGVDPERIEFEILEEPKKGIFGKIKNEAKISAKYNPTKLEISVQYLKNILDNMNIEYEVSVEENEDVTTININGDNVGAIIGRRGETLDALQYLVSIIANKGESEYHRIVIDSSGYREKRRKTLIELAGKVSKTVLRNGNSAALEPMNPYERRIIHSTVSNIEGVYSKSVGEEPFRKVIIYPLNRKYNKSRNNDKRKKKFDGPRSLDLKTSFEKDYKKPIPDKEIGTNLYGKIDI